jgi:hypothetical protein
VRPASDTGGFVRSTMFLQKNLDQTLDTRRETGKIKTSVVRRAHRDIRNGSFIATASYLPHTLSYLSQSVRPLLCSGPAVSPSASGGVFLFFDLIPQIG